MVRIQLAEVKIRESTVKIQSGNVSIQGYFDTQSNSIEMIQVAFSITGHFT